MSSPASDRPLTIIGLGEILWDLLPAGPQLGGAPANFAYHAAQLGASAFPVSCLGDDDLARRARDLLRSKGLDDAAIATDPVHPTGTVTVSLDARGAPRYVIHEDVAWDHLPWTADLAALAARADAVCFGTLAQRSPTTRDTIRRFLAATPERCLRIFDINLRQHYNSSALIRESLAVSSVFKLNDEELPAVARLLDVPLAAEEAATARAILARFNLRLIALTLGPRGSILLTAGAMSHLPAEKVEVADTVGAGDAFTAALALGLLRGHDLPTTHRAASALAAYVCTRPGAMPEVAGHRRDALK